MKRIFILLLAMMGFLYAQSAGDVIITEIMQNPDDVSDANGEWFEVYNTTCSAIDIDGWTISDNGSDSHTINNGGPLNVPANGFLVLARNSDSGANGGFTANYDYSGISLTNSDDEIILTAPGPTEIDRVEYDGGPNFPNPTGASMVLTDFTLDNNVGSSWTTATARESTYPVSGSDFGSPGTLGSAASSGADVTAPACRLISFVGSVLTGGVQDTESGLASITVVQTNNVSVNIPSFTSGTTSEVEVTVTITGANPFVAVQVTDVCGNSQICDPVYTTLSTNLPERYKLEQNFPNPFNPTTTIHFGLAPKLGENTFVTLRYLMPPGKKSKR